jgi:hypothetical protein
MSAEVTCPSGTQITQENLQSCCTAYTTMCNDANPSFEESTCEAALNECTDDFNTEWCIPKCLGATTTLGSEHHHHDKK